LINENNQKQNNPIGKLKNKGLTTLIEKSCANVRLKKKVKIAGA